MASTQEYRDYILDQLTGLEGISCRAMMGIRPCARARR